MEIACPLRSLAGGPAIVPLTSASMGRLLQSDERMALNAAIDVAGVRSGRAQNLPGPITDAERLAGHPEQTLYCAFAAGTGAAPDGKPLRPPPGSAANRPVSARSEKRHRWALLGILKTGPKNLFVRKSGGTALKELPNHPCVLDFYVHETAQRSGWGRALIDAHLQHTGLRPVQLAYDRPSPKLLAFNAKHFGLSYFTPQDNNFVLYDAFWSFSAPIGERGGCHDAMAMVSAINGGASNFGLRGEWQTVAQRPLSGVRFGRRQRTATSGSASSLRHEPEPRRVFSATDPGIGTNSRAQYGRRAAPDVLGNSPHQHYPGLAVPGLDAPHFQLQQAPYPMRKRIFIVPNR